MIFGRRWRGRQGEPRRQVVRSAPVSPPCPSCGRPSRGADPALLCPGCGAASEIYPKAIAVQTLREGDQARACDACEQVTLVMEPSMVCPDCRRPHSDVNDRMRERFDRFGPGDPADAPCVGCGYYTTRPNPPSPPLDLLIDCQGCGDEIAISEADFPTGKGMHLRCGGCKTVTEIPNTIWCPKCGQHLRRMGISELIREANRRRH